VVGQRAAAARGVVSELPRHPLLDRATRAEGLAVHDLPSTGWASLQPMESVLDLVRQLTARVPCPHDWVGGTSHAGMGMPARARRYRATR